MNDKPQPANDVIEAPPRTYRPGVACHVCGGRNWDVRSTTVECAGCGYAFEHRVKERRIVCR